MLFSAKCFYFNFISKYYDQNDQKKRTVFSFVDNQHIRFYTYLKKLLLYLHQLNYY